MLGTPEFDLFVLLVLVAMLLLMALLWRTARAVDNRAHIAAVQAELTRAIADLRVRAAHTEQRLNQVPSPREFTDLRVQMASVEAKQEAVLSEAHGARASIRRVEDFLLKAKRDHDSQF